MKEKQLRKISKKSYSPLEKRKIVEEVRSGYYSFEQTSEKYILPKKRIRKWNRWYFKIRLLRYFRAKPIPMKKNPDQQIQQLKKQLLEAQSLNEKLQLKNTALETMINIAEKQLDISIRKKSGSKQPKK